MFAGRTWGNSEEFVEGQIARLAAFPACSLGSAGVPLLIQCGRPDTFLPFVKDWRPGMEVAVFFGISEYLATALVHTFLCHVVQNMNCRFYFSWLDHNPSKSRRFAERLAARLLISSSDATRLTTRQAREAEAIQILKHLHSLQSILHSGTLIVEACETLGAICSCSGALSLIPRFESVDVQFK